MSTPQLYGCPNCGASLSLDQLRGTDCPYCRSAFPHHARAVEHAALVNQVMAAHVPMVHVAHIGAHVGAQIDAMKRINHAIAGAVAVAIALSIGITIVCAVMLG